MKIWDSGLIGFHDMYLSIISIYRLTWLIEVNSSALELHLDQMLKILKMCKFLAPWYMLGYPKMCRRMNEFAHELFA